MFVSLKAEKENEKIFFFSSVRIKNKKKQNKKKASKQKSDQWNARKDPYTRLTEGFPL